MWHYDDAINGILWVRIDRTDKPVNALSRGALEDLQKLIQRVRGDASLKGVIFKSGKPGNFIAGADVHELKDLRDNKDAKDAAHALSLFGQTVFQELKKLKVPTVALISGACLGGGLEFALACRYRIADDQPKTLLGLPEVKLGLIPGWGGTVRLPRQVGLLAALPMILTGKQLNGSQARSRGLVDDVVPPEALDHVGRTIIETGAAPIQSRRARWPSKLTRRLLATPPGTAVRRQFYKLALRKAEKEVLRKTHGHYPAPLKAIETLREGLGKSAREQTALESQAVAELAVHPVTAECIRLFFLQEAAKKPPESLGVPVEPESISRGAVIGAGAMGAGIALLMAKKNIWTRLKDLKPEFVSRGMQTVRKLVKEDVQRRRLSRLQAMRALDHLSPTTDYHGLKRADIAIEAVVEDLDIKRQVFQELAAATNERTVLATNTSSLLVSDVARDVPHPERVVGLHFFNPPHQMPLVEVVQTAETSPEALATGWALVQRLGKTGVGVGDCAGFLVNRLLSPYMNEAGYLLMEVEDPLQIERAAVEFGMPMGPLELTDLVGLDVAAHVAENIYQAYGERMTPAPLWRRLQELKQAGTGGQRRLIQRRRFGKKRLNPQIARLMRRRDRQIASRQGGGRLDRRTIIERLIYPVINEASRCLEEGIVERPEHVDLAMVFGTGFAPFRGGPLRYADSVGLERIVERLDQFAAQHPRLAPSDALRHFAEQGAFLSHSGEQRAESREPEVCLRTVTSGS